MCFKEVVSLNNRHVQLNYDLFGVNTIDSYEQYIKQYFTLKNRTISSIIYVTKKISKVIL